METKTVKINPREWTIGGANAICIGKDGTICPTRCKVMCTVTDPEHLHTLMSRIADDQCEHCGAGLLPKRKEPVLCIDCVGRCDDDCDHRWPASPSMSCNHSERNPNFDEKYCAICGQECICFYPNNGWCAIHERYFRATVPSQRYVAAVARAEALRCLDDYFDLIAEYDPTGPEREASQSVYINAVNSAVNAIRVARNEDIKETIERERNAR